MAGIKKISRYVVSGGTAAFVNLAVLYLLTDVLNIWYLFSAVVSFLVAFFVSFVMQKFWTFRDKSKELVHEQLLHYLIVGLLNLAVNTGLMFIFVSVLAIWHMAAQFIASALIAVYSFFVYGKFIFKKEKAFLSEELI